MNHNSLEKRVAALEGSTSKPAFTDDDLFWLAIEKVLFIEATNEEADAFWSVLEETIQLRSKVNPGDVRVALSPESQKTLQDLETRANALLPSVLEDIMLDRHYYHRWDLWPQGCRRYMKEE